MSAPAGGWLAGLRGAQRPRICSAPPATSSRGREVVELLGRAGVQQDPWQEWLLEQGHARRDGAWAAFEVAELVSRQNGKGGVLEGRALGGLYLFGERFIGWSAHEFKTCVEGFRRVLGLIEGCDELRRRVKKVVRSHGDEGIELHGEGSQRVTGTQRIRFMARSAGAGRGFTGDTLILDEAQHLGEAAIEAILPVLSARPDPQVWYAATAPDPTIAPCEVLARLRKRALAGGDQGLFYAEWSIDPHTLDCPPGCAEHDDPADPRSWARANPALGYRIRPERIAGEMATMSPAGFARERLGVGNWPQDDGGDWAIIAEQAWADAADLDSQIAGPLVLAAAQAPDASWGAVGAAGRRADGLLHLEVVDHQPRTSWMVRRLLELAERWRPLALVVDANGPAGALRGPLLAAGFVQLAPAAPAPPGGRVLLCPYARELAAAAAGLAEAGTDAKTLRHLDQAELNAALAGARKRDAGDGAWVLARKGSGVDVGPLEAVTLALWGFACREHLAGAAEERRYYWDPEADAG